MGGRQRASDEAGLVVIQGSQKDIEERHSQNHNTETHPQGVHGPSIGGTIRHRERKMKILRILREEGDNQAESS
ncbi:hypothetical protein GCM10022381_03910 [Leifsonia kafniensis]|uniref:Uncharacterized protein n=1 Tax=Leifsonia kafniensis TaxID=475957 RepID=A0ABP7K2D2_9MICO